MVSEQDYQRAIAEPSFRPEFLDNIYRILLPPRQVFTSMFFYPKKPGDRGVPCLNNGIAVGTPFVEFGRLRPASDATESIVYIYPEAFSLDTHTTLNDFLSTLLDHAVFHAEEAFFEPERAALVPSSPLTLFQMSLSDRFFHGRFSHAVIHKRYLERELRANRNQLKNQGIRDLSSHFVRRLLDRTQQLEYLYGP